MPNHLPKWEPSTGKMSMRICPADWSDEELSELRRVERVLQLADLAIEINCGLSDEGDPWCVISRRGSNKSWPTLRGLMGLTSGNGRKVSAALEAATVSTIYLSAF